MTRGILMESLYKSSYLWKTSLGCESSVWGYDDCRTKLVVAYEKLRDNASVLAQQIAFDLPDFTVHDITHLDALWDIASIICGKDVALNPLEAFVLGCSILIHDLGMATAAYFDGIKSIMDCVEWYDALELSLREYYGRIPTPTERVAPPPQVTRNAIENRLRYLHANQAHNILKMKWSTSEGDTYVLLEDSELCKHFGVSIGGIAASHGCSIDNVVNEFDKRIGAPPSYPVDWETDLLKIATILRLADIANIDSRRAGGVKRALRAHNELSETHWSFQDHIRRPVVQNNLLIYSTNEEFDDKRINEWWLAYDIMKSIDTELHQIDVLLKEKNRQTFVAKGVYCIDNPKKFSKYIQTQGWEPINAVVHVSDVIKLVKNLGGESLYGNNPSIPLRELISNSCDAVEARKKQYKLNDDWGKIIVRVGEDKGVNWIEVEDNGIGMTPEILAEKLLDFGNSLWESKMLIEEHKGLLSSGFNPIGKFGIGFFSVFMWSDEISVTSRSVYNGIDETYSLIFSYGLSKRPIIKKCKAGYGMKDPGTIVRILLKTNIDDLLTKIYKSFDVSLVYNTTAELLSIICRKIAPCISSSLYIQVSNKDEINVINANDWKRIDSLSFIRRLSSRNVSNVELICADLLRFIIDRSGRYVGRACILTSYPFLASDGIIVSEGVKIQKIEGIVGVIFGNTIKASRDDGKIYTEKETISAWANEQSELIKNYFDKLDNDMLLDIAARIHFNAGNTKNYPICRTNKGWIKYDEIVNTAWPDKINFAPLIRLVADHIMKIKENMIFVDMDSGANFEYEWNISNARFIDKNSLFYSVINAISESWKIPYSEITKCNNFEDEGFHYSDVIAGYNKYGEEVIVSSFELKKPKIY